MRIDGGFHGAYRELEEQMKALAKADGDVFLPNPEPEGSVQYVLICMEPSLRRWARSADLARSRVEAGFRNFLFSIEDFIPAEIRDETLSRLARSQLTTSRRQLIFNYKVAFESIRS